jgi:dienelactone hydrolase
MNIKNLIFFALTGILISCGNSDVLPVSKYYEYDKEIPLQDSIKLIKDTTAFRLYDVTYRSVHNKKVTALLTVPKNTSEPLPIIILLHGKGDRKTVDYIEFGNDYFYKNGYAVLRLDVSNHGDRIENEFDFDFTGKHKYWTRNIITQTVFDLRRAVDFIEKREELDKNNIGFFGISLGGITGAIFCGVDKRVKVPVFVLAGGQMNLMFGKNALASDTKDYLSVIEPMNFIEQITPRPLLMINAENDDIVLPMMSKLLYKKAEDPKNIIWFPAKHHTIPLDKTYQEGLNWFEKYLQ